MRANVCIDCSIEFKVKTDVDQKYYPVEFCPFCGLGLDVDEQAESEDEDEDA